MNIRKHSRRIIAVVVAGSVVGVAGGMAVAAEQRPSPSFDRVRAAELAAIARWVEDNGLTGLSPASLSGPEPSFADEARLAQELEQIAEWARSAGVSGLSPASVHSVDD
jgi:hypothetical protein